MNVKFIIDITQKITEPLKKTQSDIKRITDQIKQNNSVVLEANKNIVAASIKRRQYMKEEVQDLKELKQRRKSAYSINEIDEYNKRINETISRIRTLRSVDKGMFSGLTSRIGVMAAGAFSVYQGFNFVKSSIAAYDEEMKADAQVKASLESTGGVSGKNFAELAKEASRLQSKTLFGDEAIKGAQSVLLTFKQVRGEIFDKATPAILDLATKMKTDLNSATVQVGKALEDPITGMLNLRRSGVQFSDEQEANIKKLVEAGKLQEAQMIILNELQAQFGGSAEAAAKAGLGPWQQLGNLWGDLKEKIGGIMLSIGKGLLPVLRGMVDWLSRTIDYIRRNSEAFKTVAKIVTIATSAFVAYKLTVLAIPKIMAIATAAQHLYGIATAALSFKIGATTAALKAFQTAMMFSGWGLLVAGIAAVATGIVLLSKKSKELSGFQKDLLEIKQKTQKQFLEEKIKIEQLAYTIKDSNRSYDERKNKLDELKKISQEHFGALKLERDGVEGLDKAKQNYLATLNREIFENAVKDKKQEYLNKYIDFQSGVMDDEFSPAWWQHIISSVKTFGNVALNQIDLARTAIKNKKDYYEKESNNYYQFLKNIQGMGKQLGFNVDGNNSFLPTFTKEEDKITNNITGGEGIKNINISIANLVENITVSSQTMERGAEDFANKVKEVLLNAVNDANYQMG